MPESLINLQYPIGKFDRNQDVTESKLHSWISDIETLPKDLRALVEPLSSEQIDTEYRPGGWTVGQVVHHLPDSHMNCYIRFRLALTEDRPTIKPYNQELWAELPDNHFVPVGVSLDLLESLHARWAGLLRSFAPHDFKREFIHPESGVMNLGMTIGFYAWHGRHHYTHIKNLATRMKWI